MSLKQAIPFLRGVLSTKSTTGTPPQYVFHEGVCHANTPGILAAYPTPHILGTFGLAAEDLEAAIARMKDEPRVSAGDETLILTSGRLKSSIKVFEVVEPSSAVDPDDPDWQSLPTDFWPALQKAALFMSARGTWQTSVKVSPGSVAAVNDRSAIEVTLADLDVEADIFLPDTCVRYLDGLDAPDRHKLIDGAWLLYWSASGAWVRCQLSVFPWPGGIVDKLFGATDPAPLVELDDDWKDGFRDAIALSNSNAVVGPEGIKAPAEHATHDLPFATGVETETRWSLSVLKQLLAAADRWSPDSQGPARFEGSNCRGVVMRQR